jgi:membrane-associated phospholipid phosphatase
MMTQCSSFHKISKKVFLFRKEQYYILCHKNLLSLMVIVICGFSPCGTADLFAQNLAPLPLGSRGLVSTELRQASPDTVLGNKYNLYQFGHESVDFLIQPTKWDNNDWLRFGVVVGATLLAMQVDQPIRDAVLKDRSYLESVPIKLGKKWADIYPPVLLFGGFAIYSWLTDDIGTRKTAYEIVQALLYAGAVDKLLAIAIGRARPYVNEGPKSFHPFSTLSPFELDYESLPGGHCAIAFALSTVLSRNVKPVWLKVIVYAPSALTFVSRVYQDMHWTSDNLFGVALGYFVATWVVDQHERNDSRVRVSSLFPLTISVTLN